MKSDTDIALEFKKRKGVTERGLSRQYDNTRKCQAFYAGDIMSYQDNIQFTDIRGTRKRALVQFNKVKPYVNAVKGFMAQNRRKAKYIARLDSEVGQLYSQYANALADYVRDNANADQVESQQNGDMLTNGYGALETAMTYGQGYSTTDPNGEIIYARLDPLSVGWDPHARATNLLDARWVYYTKEYQLQEAMELFDASEDDFEEADDEDNGGYHFLPRGGRYDKIKESGVDWSNEEQEMVKVRFYQWREVETFYRAANPIYGFNNPQTVQIVAMQLQALAEEMGGNPENDGLFTFDPRAQILSFDAKIKKRLEEMLGEYIKVFEEKRTVYYTAVLSGMHVFTKFRSICQQGFSVKIKTADFDEKNKIWTGMVNSLMEPQLYYDKSLTELMFIIGSNSKGGVIVEEDAVEDIQEFEQKYAKTDAVVVVRPGAVSGGKIMPKKEPFAPTGYESIISLTDAAFGDLAGIDKAFLGSSESKLETAALTRQRIKQVQSALAMYFDADTLAQKEGYRLLMDYLLVYAENNDGRLFRMMGEDGKEQFVAIARDKFIAEYDVVIQEAPQSQEEKAEMAQTVVGVADKLAAVGDAKTAKALYSIALKYLPLEKADQQQIQQLLVPEGDQIDPAMVQQMQQQLEAATSAITQAEVGKAQAQAALDMAKIEETKANILKIQAEAQKAAVNPELENKKLNEQAREAELDRRHEAALQALEDRTKKMLQDEKSQTDLRLQAMEQAHQKELKRLEADKALGEGLSAVGQGLAKLSAPKTVKKNGDGSYTSKIED